MFSEVDNPEASYLIGDIVGGSSCASKLVEGGSSISLTGLKLSVRPGIRDLPFGIAVTYTPVPDVTVLTEVVATPDEDDGTRYVHPLPAGRVDFYPENQEVRVGLEVNTATPQTIDLAKTGGRVVIGDYVILAPDYALDGERHAVNFAFTDVDLCIGASELVVGGGAALRLAGTDIAYNTDASCLAVY